MRFLLLFFTLLFIEVSSAQGISFDVAKVPLAEERLNEHPALEVIENNLGLKVNHFSLSGDPKKLVQARNNGLIATLYEAFNDHRPVALSPDDIWMAISQGISIHVNLHFDSLKPIIFSNGAPTEISVRNDDLPKQGDAWASLTNSFSSLAEDFVSPSYFQLMSPKFTTTTSTITTAYQVCMLESMEKGLDYLGESGCGIPKITLLGEKSDWEQVKQQLDQLSIVGMDVWAKELHPVIDQFIAVYDGKIDLPFWDGIFKEYSFYGQHALSGWIIKLFPYLRTVEATEEYTEEGYLIAYEWFKPNPFLKGNDHCNSQLSTKDFPSGHAQIEILWSRRDLTPFRVDTIYMYSGFFGIQQDPKTLELRPSIGWCVADKNAPRVHHKLGRNYLTHDNSLWNGIIWNPRIAQKPHSLAIYGGQSDATTGFNAFKQDIETKTHQNFPGVTLDFTVNWDGSISNLIIGGKAISEEDKSRLEHTILHELPRWKPAEMHNPPPTPSDNGAIYFESLEDFTVVRISSNVHVDL